MSAVSFMTYEINQSIKIWHFQTLTATRQIQLGYFITIPIRLSDKAMATFDYSRKVVAVAK